MGISSSDGRIFRAGAYLISFACGSVFSAIPVWSAVQRTSQDAAAEQEFTLARSELIRMAGLLQNELARLLSDSPVAPSPELAALIGDGSIHHPRLDDASIPLHLRLVERQRLAGISGVEWARTAAGHCELPDFSPAQLVDASFRQHMQAVLQCRRQELDRYQLGVHKMNKANEATVLELKLPPFTQAAMMSQARAATNKQDADLAQVYKSRRAMYQSVDDLLRFVDAHAHEVHFTNNQLTFDKDADSKIANELINTFLAAAKVMQ